MLDVLWWYLIAQAIGLVASPLAFLLFHRMADRGLTLSKPLGLLLMGYATWILSVLHLVPSVRVSIALLLLIMGGLSGWYAWRQRRKIRTFLTREWKVLVAGEAIFLLLFLGWALFRAYDPAIDHTEQPMDFAFLNASIENRIGAPEDPWLRGHSVSYYYFGYWVTGATSELSGLSSNVTYNLALATIPALAALAIFGLVYNLIRSDLANRRRAVIGGIAAAVLLGLVANLEGVLEFMRANAMASQAFWDWIRIDGLDGPIPNPTQSWMPEEFWWWFRTSRVINTFDGGQGLDFTIQEFPFFSFMLGDLHPHVMSIPFAVLFVFFCWNFLRTPGQLWSSPLGLLSILMMGLSLGGLAFTNLWDLPTFGALLLGTAAVKTYQAHGMRIRAFVVETLPVVAAIVGLAILLFLPYYLGFFDSRPGVKGIASVELTTRPIHLFVVWGLFLAAVGPFVVVTFWRSRVSSDWLKITIVAIAAGFLPYVVWAAVHSNDGGTAAELSGRFFHILPFALLIAMAVYSSLWLAGQRTHPGRLFAMMLATLGLFLIMGPELLFIDDFFGTRMNTVFKLYYQSWILLSAAAGFAVYYWSELRNLLSGRSRLLTNLWAGAVAVLLVGSLYYPPAAAATKGDSFDGDATLDGLAYVGETRQAEYEAIRFVKRNVEHGAGILEAVGEWAEAGLISRSTGVPTVFNWPGHELQWRGGGEIFAGRQEDVLEIYQTLDIGIAKSLLAKYDVEYVYVGPRERSKYGRDGMSKFSSFMDTVFSMDDVAIYRLNRQPSETSGN